jgi:hypothetical protein
MRALLISLPALALSFTSCQKFANCKPSTLLLSYSLAGIAAVDMLSIAVTIDGKTTASYRMPPGNVLTSAVEVDFPDGYVVGSACEITVTALSGGKQSGAGHVSLSLAPVCSLASVQLGPIKDVWVDLAAPAGGDGTQAHPFARIADGLAATASLTGVTIHVAPGTYGANEPLPLVLRNGNSLDGAGADKTIIEGTGGSNRGQLGGQLSQTYSVSLVTGDAKAAPVSTISNLTVRSGSAQPLMGYYGIICDQGNAAGDDMPPPAQMPSPNVILKNVTVGPGYEAGAVATTVTLPAQLPGCNLKVTGSTFTGNTSGVWALGCGNTNVDITVALSVDHSTFAKLPLYTDTNTTLSNGITIWSCVSPVSISDNSFSDGQIGIGLPFWAPRPQVSSTDTHRFVDIERNTFTRFTWAGISLSQEAVVDKLIDNTFENNRAVAGSPTPAAALSLQANNSGSSAPQIVRARGNSFVGNDIGILWKGPTLIGPNINGVISDFGSSDDGGHNTFACNSTLSGSVPGGDVVFDVGMAAKASPISFFGNAWDHTPPHAAAGNAASNGQDVIFMGASPIVTGNDTQAPACTAPSIAGQ